jgi:NAD(P)H-hydrate epimerase
MGATSDVPPPPRALPGDAHKGDAGRVTLVCGSALMPGAAILAARAAQRAGAGLVRVACLDRRLLDVVPTAAPEAVLLDWTAVPCALPDGDHARLVGPGLGTGDAARRAARRVLEESGGMPLAIDADALEHLREPLAERAAGTGCPPVITPHPGEAARLLGISAERVQADREAAVRALARRFGAVALLKGAGTLVSDGERVWRNACGNPGLATAGAGDVLAGILAAYLVPSAAPEGIAEPRERALWAARAAAWVHGLAGDLAAAELGQRGLIASDLVDYLPRAQGRATSGAAAR